MSFFGWFDRWSGRRGPDNWLTAAVVLCLTGGLFYADSEDQAAAVALGLVSFAVWMLRRAR
jgi:hypothetical protein